MRFRKLDRALHLQPRVVSHSDLLTNIVVKVQKTSNHGKHRGPIFVPDVGGDHTMTVQHIKLINFLALATRHLLRYNNTWPPDTITPVTRYKRQMPETINCVSCLDEDNRNDSNSLMQSWQPCDHRSKIQQLHGCCVMHPKPQQIVMLRQLDAKTHSTSKQNYRP